MLDAPDDMAASLSRNEDTREVARGKKKMWELARTQLGECKHAWRPRKGETMKGSCGAVMSRFGTEGMVRAKSDSRNHALQKEVTCYLEK